MIFLFRKIILKLSNWLMIINNFDYFKINKIIYKEFIIEFFRILLVICGMFEVCKYIFCYICV